MKNREELLQEMQQQLENAQLLQEIAIPGVEVNIDKDANKAKIK